MGSKGGLIFTWYYDNRCEAYGSNPDFAWVERVYCLRFRLFTEQNWADLESLYNRLPGEVSSDETGLPYWFGTDEENPPYLWASFEPQGLQVEGILKLQYWLSWDEVFRTEIFALALPIYET